MGESPVKSLTPFYRNLAKKEVGENAEHVMAHLTSFKRWLAASPHLKIPQVDTFLLSFLRYAHYDHALAQRRIDNFCTLRYSDKHISPWYEYPKLDDPRLEKYLNAGIFVPLGFMDNGMYVILIRLASWSPAELDQVAMRAMNNMNFERLLFDQRCQIGGFTLLIDMAHTTMEQATQWGDFKHAKSAFKLMQESSPGRVKNLIFYKETKLFDFAFKLAEVWLSEKMRNRESSPGRVKNLIFYKETKLFDFAFKLAEVWLSEKMRNRVTRVKDDINKAFKKIPGLKDVLPLEYHGKNGTLEEALARCNRELREFYANGNVLQDIAVDESKRPSSARNYIREYKELDQSMMGTSGTFIKLDPRD
ncbi:alpha-tocopherol transfer protein-like [Clonorchis sinensis]|uniref:Alpha-tocopherol transfer protein-like n=1 Tax=Clonorchis sinensis TaxID=79923 RepID=G7Y8Z2_CLOSI|nr:alpha-tocopherol transfer protein-like [Clonorchis sinensis]